MQANQGQIVTFYSFKGGVGRTMALANVAFLAAQNGYKVLVMDWDLEAPGLAYYFRGLMDTTRAKTIRDAPGVLDIFWEWSAGVRASSSSETLDSLLDRFNDGTPFESCVVDLTVEDEFADDAALHFIGAGSRSIETPSAAPYEEALANFSWQGFFENDAGGAMLQAFRNWAKRQYDFVLLDSRTGLADVAGICTMQLPDVVALCFILNRQNIDGISKVAAAIRSKRADKVRLRALPMRVARQNTSEESDARARALTELAKVGGFTNDAVQEDFRLLAVNSAENVPFYETLSPFSAADPALDVLTINYLRLGSQLLGVPLEPRPISQELIQSAQRRLRPTHATIEYVLNLKSAEPSRALAELQTLIESAAEAEMDGQELNDDYVVALVEAAFSLATLSGTPIELINVLSEAMNLLRSLMAQQQGKWEALLASSVERYLESYSYFLEPEEEIAFLEELDALLSLVATPANLIKRLSHRRRAARLFIQEKNFESAQQTVGEVGALLGELSKVKSLTPEQIDALRISEVELSLLKGDADLARENANRAYPEFTAGLRRTLDMTAFSGRADLARLKFELHSRLAEAPPHVVPLAAAAQHAVDAYAALEGIGIAPGTVRFMRLARVVIDCADLSRILAFYEAALDRTERNAKVQLAAYLGRQTRSAIGFLRLATETISLVTRETSERSQKVLASLAEICELVLKTFARRRQMLGGRFAEEVSAAARALMREFELVGIRLDAEEWVRLVESLGAKRGRRVQRDV